MGTKQHLSVDSICITWASFLAIGASIGLLWSKCWKLCRLHSMIRELEFTFIQYLETAFHVDKLFFLIVLVNYEFWISIFLYVHHLNSCIVFPPCLQAAEFHLIELFQVANLCAIHAKRVTVSKLSLNELLFPSVLLRLMEMWCILVTRFFSDSASVGYDKSRCYLKWQIAYEWK